MSNSNHKVEYEADKCQQAEQPAALNFIKDKEDFNEYQNLLHSPEPSETQETSEDELVAGLSDDNPADEFAHDTEKSLRKKDSTGVRWVDWEGVAAICENKGTFVYLKSITPYECISASIAQRV